MGSHTVQDFATLSRIGKVRRIGRLAATAMRAYDIDVHNMRVHAFATNLLYSVQATTGARFMLRMAYPGWRTLEDLQAEAVWLDALHRDTDIGAPLIVRAASGEQVLPMHAPGVPDTWYAMLMTWVDGRVLAHHLTSANLERMGELFARLHLHGKTWQPPADFSTKRFEAFLSRGEPDVLFADDDGVMKGLRDDDRRAFLRARMWVEQEYSSLDRNDLRVIHCDLWHENIKVDHGRLRPFDFEDTIWGYRLHDIAMSMLDLLETVGGDRYAELLAAFRCGYVRRLDWPEGKLEVLQIGRLLWKANYVARFARDSLGALSAQYGDIFRGFEHTGELRLPEQPLQASA